MPGVRRIPLAPGEPNTRQRVVLDGREYTLVIRWSHREERFYLDLFDGSNAPLVLGIKVIENWPLLYRFRAFVRGLPAGDLVAIDLRPTPAPPRLNDLGDVVELCYREAA